MRTSCLRIATNHRHHTTQDRYQHDARPHRDEIQSRQSKENAHLLVLQTIDNGPSTDQSEHKHYEVPRTIHVHGFSYTKETGAVAPVNMISVKLDALDHPNDDLGT